MAELGARESAIDAALMLSQKKTCAPQCVVLVNP